MNSVHEPGPNDDSETISSRKTRSKTNPGARAPKLAQLGTPRRAQARPGARMAARWQSYRGLRGAVSWVPVGRVAGAPAVL